MIYQVRLQKLQKAMKKASIDALLIDDKIDLLYLTGIEMSAGMLIVHSKNAKLIVDSRYFELCCKKCPFPVELIKDQPFSIFFDEELRDIKTLGIDNETTSYKKFDSFKKNLKDLNINSIDVIPVDSPVKWERMIKDEPEIKALKEAATLGSEGYDFLLNFLKEGITEEECAQELDIFWKRKGSKTVAFDPIIAFGKNSSMPHYRAASAILKKGDIVLLDIGVNFKNYHSDMTRVAFFGEPDPRLLDIHSVVQKAQKAALDLCKPGTLISDLDKAARDLIADFGHAKHFTHNLGHGIGLEIHEYPSLKNAPPFSEMKLMPGMVITIEPGIYLPDIGGVRIEDTVVITDNGHENLTLRNTDPIFIP